MQNGLITTLRESVRYRGKENQWMWMAHRVSGLGVLFFLIIHVIGESLAFFNPPLHDAMLELYKTPVFAVLELGLAACLVFHAVNGARVALLELRPEWWLKQSKAAQITLATAAVLGIPLVITMAAYSVRHFLLK